MVRSEAAGEHAVHARLWRLAFRQPKYRPAPGWPIGVRSVGHAEVAAGFADEHCRRQVLMVLWSVAGGGRLRLGRRDHDLPAGSWAWLWPGSRYRISTAAQSWELRWLSFDGPAITAWSAGWAHPTLPAMPARPLDAAMHDRLLGGIARPGLETRLSCLEEATALLARGLAADAGDDLCQRALRLIAAEHAASGFDVAALARRLDCHRSHLSRRLRAELGAGPAELLRERRLDTARHLLLTTDAAIETIAHRSGFAGPDQLGRNFRAAYGLPPSQWRRRAPAVE